MKNFWIFIILIVFTTTHAQNDESRDFPNKFVRDATYAGMVEVALGNLALVKGNSNKVKDFGKLIVKDHSKANEELTAIAKKNDISIPNILDDKNTEKIDEMSEIENENFDEEYLNVMIEDHEKNIEEFEEAAENNENEDVRKWAKKTLTTLRQHLKQAINALESLEQFSKSE